MGADCCKQSKQDDNIADENTERVTLTVASDGDNQPTDYNKYYNNQPAKSPTHGADVKKSTDEKEAAAAAYEKKMT